MTRGNTTYSVWDPQMQRYDYYQVVGNALRDGVFAPEPMHLMNVREHKAGLGVTVDQAARKLPAGAQLVGHGESARGLIATRTPAAGGMGLGDVLGFDTRTVGTIALIVAGIYAYKRWA